MENHLDILDDLDENRKGKRYQHAHLLPCWILWGLALFILISGLGMDSNSALDFQIFDTYYVIALSHLRSSLAIFYVGIGFVYFLMRQKNMIRWMTFFHVCVLALNAIIAIVFGSFNLRMFYAPFANIATFAYLNSMFTGFIALLVVANVLFIINVIVTLFRKNII